MLGTRRRAFTALIGSTPGEEGKWFAAVFSTLPVTLPIIWRKSLHAI